MGLGALLPGPPASLDHQHPWTISVAGPPASPDLQHPQPCLEHHLALCPSGTTLKYLLHHGGFSSPSWDDPGVENLVPGCEERSGQGMGEGSEGI